MSPLHSPWSIEGVMEQFSEKAFHIASSRLSKNACLNMIATVEPFSIFQ
jgi:hypothetical protein